VWAHTTSISSRESLILFFLTEIKSLEYFDDIVWFPGISDIISLRRKNVLDWCNMRPLFMPEHGGLSRQSVLVISK
jgi:hypothetical protein